MRSEKAERVWYDAFHSPAQRRRRHRSGSRRAEGGESGDAGAGRPADAGRLLHHGGRLSAADPASRTRRRCCRATRTPISRRSAALRSRSGCALSEPISRRTILRPLLARGVVGASRQPAAVRSSALIEDRADANFAGQFESFLGAHRRHRISDRGARLLGGAVDQQCAPLHGAARSQSGRHRDGGADPAAGRGARLRRRLERDAPTARCCSAPPGGSARRSRRAKWCRTASC